MGTSVEPQPVAPNPPGGAKIVESSFLAQENQLLTIVQQYMAPAEVEQVSLAFQLAQETCKDVQDSLSPTSIPPLEHALAVATILADMHIDAVGVAAGLLFEAVDAERLALERVESALGPAIARVVGSMLRLNILERKKQAGAILARTVVEGESNREQKKRRNRENLRRLQAETVRKMFFAMAEDPRVVLLKLAYRLHAMRLIQAASYPVDHQDMLTMAQETREIYAPLAGRLGMARVESELEDLAFAILEPEKYAWIRNQVEVESKQWRSYVDRVCTMLREEMAKLGLRAEVSGRVKHLYSFYQKLKRTTGGSERLEDLQVADFSQIHDLIAFRILVESTPDCYLALGHVHSLWKPKEGRIKDFIANPKSNGYRALHTTVFCLDDQLVEIQIRTRAMHEMAEYGVAMHWHYKDVGDHASASARELLTWLRQLADWQRDLRSFATSDTEFIEAVKDDIFQEQIFVFTPKGEVKDLPIGSTPLDFAYRVHSKVGDKCAGARVTTEHGPDRLVTRMVPLDYELRSGDIVDIVTNRTAHPTRDWLSFARTTAARSKIRRYLKIHERAINIQIGRERLERERKDEKNGEALLPLPVAPKQVPSVRMQVAGVSGLLTRLANCCCPLPGDEIVGFISRGKGAIVHRADCKNIDRYRERERERLINVSWTSMGQQHYLAPITITARDRSGLIRDIAAVVSEAGVNMTTVNSYASVGKEVVLVNATLEIESLDQMQRLFVRIEKVKNVLHVERDLGKGRKA